MKKSYLRTFVTLLIVGAILLAIGLLAPLVYIQSNDLGPVCALAQSADGNGYVYYFDEPISYANLFWTQFNGLWASLTLLGCAMVLSSAFALIFHKFVSKTCGLITSLHSLALSVFGSTGLVFALLTLSTSGSATMRYPYANPTFFVCGLICLFICICLLLSYFIQWYKKASFRGLFLEMLLTILYLPAFFWLSGSVVDFLWDVLKNFI